MTISFLLLMLITMVVMFVITKVGVDRITKNHYLQRVDFFNNHMVSKDDIVMVGDSLTAGGNWDELFPGLPIRNRGINADLSTGVLARLDDITSGKPAAIFILIGTNDLPWHEYRHDELIIGTYQEILRKIKKDSPDTRVFVQSLLPRAQSYANRIRQLNLHLQKLAETEGVTFIDLYPHFVGQHGELRADLNNDHLHLLAAGYNIWQEILTPYIKQVAK